MANVIKVINVVGSTESIKKLTALKLVLVWVCLQLAVLIQPVYAKNLQLAESALERTKHSVVYDGKYLKIPYPNGDVPETMGVCTDVVIRSYRALGIDLQKRVHEDMAENFSLYPKHWGLSKPDTNIDHRRVPNLEVFFKRFGTSLPISDKASDYQPGDVVSWRLANGLPHIGIVSSIKSASHPERYQIIHNIGWGPKLEDKLFAYKINGHWSYD